MNSSWFDVGVVDDVIGVGFPSRRRDRDVVESRTRWTSIASSHNMSAASVSHRTFLEETRSLDLDLQATSARLREATRFDDSHGDTSGLSSRRLQFSQRFNDLLRRNSIVDDMVSSENHKLQDEVNQQRKRLKSLEDKYREHIAVLEFQVKAHKDDWEVERREKQQVLKDKTSAEIKVRQLQKDVRCLKLKLKEERIGNALNLCAGCGQNAATEAETVIPTLNLKDNKTYRTSVHLPLTLVQNPTLKPKGTTLTVYDDVVIDVEDLTLHSDTCVARPISLKTQIPPDGCLRSGSISDEDSLPSFTESAQKPVESILDAVPSQRHVQKKNGLSKHNIYEGNNEIFQNTLEYPFVSIAIPKRGVLTTNESKIAVSQSASQPNLTTHSTLSCSVVSITPCLSTNNTASTTVENVSELSGDGNSGVTIGYSSSGLASVCSFQQTPIVKSYSLPTSRVADKITSFECEFPVSESSSLGSSWSALANNSPTTQVHVAGIDSTLEEKKSGKLSILGAFAKSMKQSKDNVNDNKEILPDVDVDERASSQNTAVWKAKYFENGIATQTGEDLMCPTCGQIFPLIEHVKFLDHFEKCQIVKKY